MSFKKTAYLIVFCCPIMVLTQSKLNYNIEPIEAKKTLKNKYIVIENDTLFAHISPLSDTQIQNFCAELNNPKTISLYKDIVFNNLSCNQFERVFTKQWISKIFIYFDKEIPKSVQREFKNFYTSFKIMNLKLEFVRNIEKSNYLITTTKDTIPNIKLVKSKSELYPYNHITYSLSTDNNSKFYSGILKINLETITNRTLILPKLKQMFFMSLGQFTADKDVKTNSLLSYRYENTAALSKEDFDLLRLHYLKIHDTPLSCHYFSSFIKNLQSKCSTK